MSSLHMNRYTIEQVFSAAFSKRNLFAVRLLINKIDLLPHVDCSVEKIKEDSLKINPDLAIFEISCKTGEGIEDWYNWVRERAKDKEASQ